MAELQTDYGSDIAPGYAGMVANGETSNRISRTIEDADGIGFGVAAFRGAEDHTCTATPAAGDLLGITMAHVALGQLAGQAADTYPHYENVGIMTQGTIWVLASEAVAAGDQAYATPAGAIGKTATGNVILDGWFFDTSAAADAVAKLVRR